ncbi:MAG: alkaline phosphatase [Muribaculaceae bacterium]|nr:alkaline phosphatase [Muribaculaceae bacterium]
MKKKHFALSIALAGLCALTAGAETPKYIFYFIGDGMGMGHVMATRNYLRTVHNPDSLPLMMTFPVASPVQTYSFSSTTTDSAAAGTALSTGNKTNNYMLGVSPDTIPVTSIAVNLKDQGYGIGIITSVAPDDATPGAFYAHVRDRKLFDDITADAAASGYDLIAGAGLRGSTDAADVLRRGGFDVVYGLDEFNASTAPRKFLLDTHTEHPWSIGYTIDGPWGSLNLPDMTEAAISHLSVTHPERFFLMCEGGNIDHAAHSNDGAAVIREVLAFQDAIRHAYNFYLEHPDETLIIVTADHDTGGMAAKGNARFDLVDIQKMSKDKFNEMCRNIAETASMSWPEMKTQLRELFSLGDAIPLSEKDEAELSDMFAATMSGTAGSEQTIYNSYSDFVGRVFRIINEAMGIGWITGSHTSNPVPVFAIGNGAERFGYFMNNTDIPYAIIER